jgi:hypothetical protein
MSRDAPPSRLVESLAMLPDHPFGDRYIDYDSTLRRL